MCCRRRRDPKEWAASPPAFLASKPALRELVCGGDDAVIRDAPLEPDSELGQALRELEPLSALEPGAQATIVRLAEHDGDLLHWFYDQGLVPGTSILVRTAEPAADQFTVAIEKVGERAISEKAAAGLFVLPAA